MATINDYITAEEAAEIIGVCHSQVTRYCASGSLPNKRMGNQIWIKRRAAVKFQRPPRGNPRHVKTRAG